MGHSGGILVGIKDETYELEESKIGDYFINMVLRSRLSNVRWELITVYGPAQHISSCDFISELSRKCMSVTLPLLLVGDFNLIRFTKDKNNSNLDQALMDKFNMFIDLFQLQEIRRSGVKFTWTNKQINLVMINLDRILVSTEWEAKFPKCFAWCKTRVGSDHWHVCWTLENTLAVERSSSLKNSGCWKRAS
jgi:hypothetical protein